MKKPKIFLLVSIILSFIFLASCAQGGNDSNALNCSAGGEICIVIDKVQPITMGDPMPITINVSSKKDFSDTHVTLFIQGGTISVDLPQTWENSVTAGRNDAGTQSWEFAIKADQTLSFKRVIRFPLEEGYYSISVELVAIGRRIRAYDGLVVSLEHRGVQVIRPGTPAPDHTLASNSPAYGLGTPHPTYDPLNMETLDARRRETFYPTATFTPIIVTFTPNPLQYYPPPAAAGKPTSQPSPYP